MRVKILQINYWSIAPDFLGMVKILLRKPGMSEATDMVFFLSKLETSTLQTASIFWLIEHSPGSVDRKGLEIKLLRNPVSTICKIPGCW